MSADPHENHGFVARLLRKQQRLAQPRLQFTLRSLLLGMGYLSCFIWLVQFIVRTRPLGIPILVQLWFLFLWVSVIGGACVSQNAWWYFIGGVIGVALASPLLVEIFVNDVGLIPLISAWYVSFFFATFANLGGAIHAFRNHRESLGLLNLAAFVFSVVLIVIVASTA